MARLRLRVLPRQALNANNAINELNNRPKSPYNYHQFGGMLGGPLRQNRDFVFFNYDGQRNTQPNTVFLNLPANTPSDPATQAGIARLTPLAESWERRLDQDVFLIKTAHQIGAQGLLTFRYNHQNFTGEGFENGGAQNSIEHTGASIVKTRSFNAAWNQVVGATLSNELKLQYLRDKEPGEANNENPEAVVQQSGTTVLTIGRNNFSPRETTIERCQLADWLTWISDRHRVKTGFDFQSTTSSTAFPASSAAPTRSAAWPPSPAAARMARTSSVDKAASAGSDKQRLRQQGRARDRDRSNAGYPHAARDDGPRWCLSAEPFEHPDVERPVGERRVHPRAVGADAESRHIVCGRW